MITKLTKPSLQNYGHFNKEFTSLASTPRTQINKIN